MNRSSWISIALYSMLLVLLFTMPIMADNFSPGWRARSWPETPTPPETHLDDWHIAIDPGHGGDDGGASPDPDEINIVGDPLSEKHFTLAISTRLQALLVQDGAQVTMTRDADETLSLDERIQIANNAQAHRFLSVHINACCGARGIETWVDADGTNRTTTGPVWDHYAKSIHDGLIAGAHTIDSSVPNRGVKYSGITGPWNDSRIRVLRDDLINMPAALVEVNFITTQAEYDLLIRSDYQQAVAEGIADGFRVHAEAYRPEDGILR